VAKALFRRYRKKIFGVESM